MLKKILSFLEKLPAFLSFGTLLFTLTAWSSSPDEAPLKDAKAQMGAYLLMADLGLINTPIDFESVEILKWASQDIRFEVFQVQLNHAQAGKIRFLLRGPRGFMNPPSKFPTLTLIAGFFTGQDSLHLLNSENTNLNSVTLAFQYPFNLEDIKKDPSKFLHLLRLTPGQIALLLTWLKRQSWSDSEKSTVMGVSLGGLFLPVSIHIAQKLGSYQKNTIFVCTGGDLSKILKPNLEQLFGTYFSQLIADSLFDLTSILSPELHAPWLESKFLFIRTKEDQVFSPQSSQILFDHLNSPKIEIVLDGPHVMPDQIELIHRIEKTIKTWLR